MNGLTKKLLILSLSAAISTPVLADKLSREEIEKNLPALKKQVISHLKQYKFFEFSNVELGEGSSLVLATKIKADSIDQMFKEDAIKLNVCSYFASNQGGILKSLDYIQYNYTDVSGEVKFSIKVTEDDCNLALANTPSIYNDKGKYTREYIQKYIIEHSLGGIEAYNRSFKDSMTEIRDLKLGEGSSYIVEYAVFDQLRDVYKNADEEVVQKLSKQFVSSMCNQRLISAQLPYVDYIQYDIYDKDGEADAKSLLHCTISAEVCDTTK